MRRVALCLLLGLGLAAQVFAADPIEELVVSGEQPGPGLWQVRHGDHSLWILATLSPLPAKMRWRTREVETLVARSQQVIAPMNVRAGIGLFTGLRLLPAVLKARALPKGSTLSTVLPPALYARWLPLKQRYLGRSDKVERWRPMFAGGELYEAALADSKLDRRLDIWSVVERAAQRANVPVRTPKVELSIADPRAVVQDFTLTPLAADIACFESLVVRTETELPVLRQRAMAWARGDVQAMRQLPLEDTETRCLGAALSSPRVAREYAEALRRVRQDWLLAAEGALLRNATSVAVMPMREMLAPDGLLAQLRARGYEVVEP